MTVSAVARADDGTLRSIEHYLNGLTTVTAKFSQVAPNGEISEGIFYLQRPGKMRWEYAAPIPIVMVSNGDTLVYYDKELSQKTYIPLKDTLAALLVRDHISLSGDIVVDEIEKGADNILVTLHQAGKADEGGMIMEFQKSPLQLRSLSLTDAIMQQTKISFTDAKFGGAIESKVFVLEEDIRHERK